MKATDLTAGHWYQVEGTVGKLTEKNCSKGWHRFECPLYESSDKYLGLPIYRPMSSIPTLEQVAHLSDQVRYLISSSRAVYAEIPDPTVVPKDKIVTQLLKEQTDQYTLDEADREYEIASQLSYQLKGPTFYKESNGYFLRKIIVAITNPDDYAEVVAFAKQFVLKKLTTVDTDVDSTPDT